MTFIYSMAVQGLLVMSLCLKFSLHFVRSTEKPKLINHTIATEKWKNINMKSALH